MAYINGKMSEKPLQIAILAEEVQMTDVAGMDVLGNCSTEYVRACQSMPNTPDLADSRELNIHWVSSSLKPARMTADLLFNPTITYDDCPRDMDIVLIGGPMPTHRPEASLKFMREMFPKTKVVMTTCIGSWWLADAGVLDGLKCTTNREMLEAVKKARPQVEWLDQRWVVEQKPGGGELWTSGGAQAGMTLICSQGVTFL